MSDICVVGSWHLASVMSVCFAAAGHTVIGVDDDIEAINSLAAGRPTVFEPKLKSLLTRNIKAGRLRALAVTNATHLSGTSDSAVYVVGTSHTADIYAPRESNIPALTAAYAKIAANVAKYLGAK